jgi:trigger factor
MQVNIEELSAVERKLSFTLDAAKIDAALNEAYRNLGKQVKMPGFRPGKVPRKVLEQRFGKHIGGEVGGQLISEAFDAAIDEHDLFPVSQPIVEQGTLKAGTPYEFSVTVEIKPSVSVEGWDGLDVEWERAEVTDEQVQAELDELASRNATFEAADKDHKAGEGDLALVDITATADGLEDKTLEGYPIQVGAESYGMPLSIFLAPKVVGKKTGGKGTAKGEVPTGALGDEWDGVEATVKFVVKEIKTQKMPTLDDDFAQDEGHESLELLKADIRFKLGEQLRKHLRSHAADFALDKLGELNPFEVPRGLVRAEAEGMLQQQMRQFAGMGQRMPQIRLEQLGEEAQANFLEQAETMVRRALILEAVAEAAKVEVTDADVDEKIAEMATEIGQQPAAVKGLLMKQGGMDGLKSRIREEKAVDTILERANIVEIEPKDHSHHDHGDDAAPAHGEAGHVHGPDCDHD